MPRFALSLVDIAPRFLLVCLAGFCASFQPSPDQALLAKTAVNVQLSWNVRIAAVDKLTDQNLLVKVAVYSKTYNQGLGSDTWNVQREAIYKLTDQALLAKLAVENKDHDIREEAVMRLTDQALLAKIAAHDKELSVRFAASKRAMLPALDACKIRLARYGVITQLKSELDGSIAECTKAITFGQGAGIRRDIPYGQALLPIESEAYSTRGRAEKLKGDFDSAIADFTKAIEIKHATPDYILSTTTYESAGRPEEDLDSRAEAKRLKGDYDGALADIAEAEGIVKSRHEESLRQQRADEREEAARREKWKQESEYCRQKIAAAGGASPTLYPNGHFECIVIPNTGLTVQHE